MNLKDLDGNMIHTYTYEGGVTGEMMGVKDTFVPSTTLTDFVLETTLYQNGQSVESVSQTYKCADIDPSLCVKAGLAANSDNSKNNTFLILGAFSLMVLSLLAFVYYRYQIQKKSRGVNPYEAVTLLLVMSVATLGSLFTQAVPVHAQSSVTHNTGNSIPALYHYHRYKDNKPSWNKGLDPSNASVTYRAKMTNVADGTTIPNGTSLPVGTRFKVERDTPKNTDVSWVGTGYGYDSPYGRWINNAGAPPEKCDSDGFVAKVDYGSITNILFVTVKQWNWSRVYAFLTIDPPATKVVPLTSNVTCSVVYVLSILWALYV
jgi:hypothetical protein